MHFSLVKYSVFNFYAIQTSIKVENILTDNSYKSSERFKRVYVIPINTKSPITRKKTNS